MNNKNRELLKQAYEAFNRRDVDEVLGLLHPDVRWANGWEGGYVHGPHEVRTYWERQWEQIDPKVTPTSIVKTGDGRWKVTVQQVVKDKQGQVLFEGIVYHTYAIQNGKITEMEIEQPEDRE